MPTEPDQPILDRDLSKIKPFTDKISPVLQELINYSTQFYQRCQISRECKGDESYPILALYLHIIQMADSIEVLISNGCTEPANLLVRSSFEAKLSIKYILEKNIITRSMSWMTKNIVDHINNLESCDPSNPKYKDLTEILEQDGLGHSSNIFNRPEIQNISEKIKHFNNILNGTDYVEPYTEYLALRKSGKGYPESYSFYNGTKNLKELAKYLKEGST